MREVWKGLALTLAFACGAGNAGSGAPVAEAPGRSVTRDLSYAPGPAPGDSLQRLDVHAPADAYDLPVVVWVHGGGWEIGDKSNVRHKPDAFDERGYVFVSANYRLAPAADYRQMAGDVAAALTWVHRNIGRYGGSQDEIYVGGHSAGAHLVALVLSAGAYLEEVPEVRAALRGAFLLDGAGYDLPLQLRRAGPRVRDRITRVFGTDPATLEAASPAAHVREDRRICPLLFVYAGRREASRVQAERMAEKLRALGHEAMVAAAPRDTHRTLNRELGAPGHAATGIVFEFLEKLRKRDT